ncbi:hypothetical protein HHUSO_G17889 [Huso huso]|uniref:Uncharacterized protein n=1 Tax=Huso huso TaxID=61971 RepID=A0ABR0Z5X6_HUSHU
MCDITHRGQDRRGFFAVNDVCVLQCNMMSWEDRRDAPLHYFNKEYRITKQNSTLHLPCNAADNCASFIPLFEAGISFLKMMFIPFIQPHSVQAMTKRFASPYRIN